MNRFNSLFVFHFLSFSFAVSVSSAIGSPNQHVNDALYFNPDHAVVPTQARNSTSSKEDLDLLNHFTNFIKKYGRSYADQDEHAYRLSVFKTNLRRAKRNQKLDPTAIHGITQFSDLTTMEFRRKLVGLGVKRVKPTKAPTNVNRAPILPTNDLPTDFDWRDHGAVSPVKDQQYCSASYAFSALGAIEGAFYVQTGREVDLSEQAIIDCSYRKYYIGDHNNGCQGGSIHSSLEHVRRLGFVPERRYPYTSGRSQRHGFCRIPNRISRDGVVKFSFVNSMDEDQIAANLVKYGPLAVSLRIKSSYLQTYGSGVLCPYIRPDLGNDDRRGVVLVGYGAGAYSTTRLKEEPFWIFKNSWGANFGEKGFFRTCRGTDELYGIDYAFTFFFLINQKKSFIKYWTQRIRHELSPNKDNSRSKACTSASRDQKKEKTSARVENDPIPPPNHTIQRYPSKRSFSRSPLMN